MTKKNLGEPAGNALTDAALIMGLTTRQILIGLLDALPQSRPPYVSRDAEYRRVIREYRRWRAADRKRFLAKVNYLRRQGLIRTYRRGKGLVMALTEEGHIRASRAALGEIKLPNPKQWDRRWHVIIFDIPEKAKGARDVFRAKLRQLGFVQLQKSVFVHPFDATDLVTGIRSSFGLTNEIRYIVADQVEDEQVLIHHFLKRKILHPSHFRRLA